MVYDALLVVGMWLFTLFPLVAATNDAVSGATIQSLLFVELFAFFAFFWVARGQTLGMLAWRLHLESASSTITLKQALLRFIGALLGAATLGLGYLWMFVDADKRTWPDLFSDTRVIYVPK